MQAATVQLLKLNNGIEIPQLGLGVWKAEDGTEVENAIATAFASGYRLIDTAKIYGNEEGVGHAINDSELTREEIFVTTKLWNEDQGYDSTLKAFDASLDRLGLDYVDLYLIHWPVPSKGKFIDTWKAFEKLYDEKLVRAIGVSNFTADYMEELLSEANVAPAVNQIELHPKFQQHETREFCDKHNIKIESYSPIMHGGEVLNDPKIQDLAEKYERTPAQIVLRWHVQNGFIVIPKSVTPERIRENIDVFDFELTNEDMHLINGMDASQRVGSDPDTM